MPPGAEGLVPPDGRDRDKLTDDLRRVVGEGSYPGAAAPAPPPTRLLTPLGVLLVLFVAAAVLLTLRLALAA